MTTPSLSVGVVGLGYGRAHIPAFQARGCRVVAVCQRNEAAAKAVADRYGVPHIFTRWEDLLDCARPDIVVIATPPHLHLAIARRAFAAGAHVLCEKPLATTRAEAQAMVDAAARARRVAMTGFNWRFTPAMQRLQALVTEGALGRVFHVATRWLGARWADPAAPPTWRMDRSQAGFGAMGDMGVHLIDLVRSTFGEFRRVVAHAGIAYPDRRVPGGGRPADAEDFCTVLAELATGAQVSLTVSRVARGAGEHTLEAYGADGAVTYRVGREGPTWWTGELRAARGDAPLAPLAVEVPGLALPASADAFDVIAHATLAPLVERMLAAIARGGPASPSLEDGLRAQAVLDAAQASATRGGWIDVPG